MLFDLTAHSFHSTLVYSICNSLTSLFVSPLSHSHMVSRFHLALALKNIDKMMCNSVISPGYDWFVEMTVSWQGLRSEPGNAEISKFIYFLVTFFFLIFLNKQKTNKHVHPHDCTIQFLCRMFLSPCSSSVFTLHSSQFS